MPFLKEDLLNPHYNWEDEDPSIFSGTPSRRSFNRFNGNQVLFLINFFGSMSDKFSPEEGRQMENLILHHLPDHAKSEISVVNWLKTALQENH
jgi:hypothetical protein